MKVPFIPPSFTDRPFGCPIRPVAIDLFCGLGGWTEGLLAEGWDVIGFDIERHQYGDHRYPGQLVIQDVRTLHGSQFKNAALIVASPPCQEYSYMAMPWKLAKARAKAIREDATGEKLAALNRLFNECFRIQKEASFAAGRHIPLVVENVKGAQPWVGRARFNFGSFYLWGDVPALMPIAFKAIKAPGMNWSDQTKRGQDFTRLAGNEAIKNKGWSWFNVGSPGQKVTNKNPVHELSGRKADGGTWFGNYAEMNDGIKQGGSGREWFAGDGKIIRMTSNKSPARKFASAMIAKIPAPLSRHIAVTFHRGW